MTDRNPTPYKVGGGEPNKNNTDEDKFSYDSIIQLSKENKSIIISLIKDNTYTTIDELYKHIPVRMLKYEIEELEYYEIITVSGKIIEKGNKFDEVNIDDLPPIGLLSVTPIEKLIYEIIKMKPCLSYYDIEAVLKTYGIQYNVMSIGKSVNKLINAKLISKDKMWGNVHIYKAKYNLFISPPRLEDKIREAKEYLRKWDYLRKTKIGEE